MVTLGLLAAVPAPAQGWTEQESTGLGVNDGWRGYDGLVDLGFDQHD
jgi:hypothetical protein